MVFLLRTTAAAEAPTAAQDSGLIARGRYLTVLGDCAACHTDPRQNAAFAGGRPVETPFGNVLASNITPDRDTGIGAWSDSDFDDALRQGKMPNGKRLYPAMPFPYYTRMSKEDVLAIRAYLKTVPAVHKEVISNQLPFPFNIRMVMRIWDALYFTAEPLKLNAARSLEWNRGAYLVEGPGHCGACHTPKTWLGGDELKRKFHGYSIQGWFAPNITNDEWRGLGKWASADIVEYLHNGHNRFTGAAGPMGEEVSLSSSGMTAPDLTAIATYLKDQRGNTHESGRVPDSDAAMVAGGSIYRDLCAACHAMDGTGVPYLYPDLAESSLVDSREATSLVRVVLNGAQTVATQAEPTAPSMPAFDWQLTDEQVAAVTTYIRNSWGHASRAVTTADVRRARTSLGKKAD
jgi:mono/diheme cytochrome c family protein